MLEHFFNQNILCHMEDNNLLTDMQMAFMRRRYTEESCFGIVDNILNSTNDNKFSISVYVDVVKVFNTMNHSLLLHKIIQYGFSDKIIRLRDVT